MNANVDLQHIRRSLAGYVLQGTLDQRVIQPLMVPDGFVPKEYEFWDYLNPRVTAEEETPGV